MAIGKDITELQKSINYIFSDLSYLERAMTHSSYSYEMKTKGISFSSNERLEFLGDAVLEIVISRHLYDKFSDLDEGLLTKIRQNLVCEKTLSRIAKSIELGSYLNLGRGEEQSGLRERTKVLADALEALLAAVYLDSRASGSDVSERLILDLFSAEIENSRNMQYGDFKTVLQQLVEKDGSAILEYTVVSEQGPEHRKLFEVEARVNNNLVGKGVGATKKEAEMLAAKEALSLFGVNI